MSDLSIFMFATIVICAFAAGFATCEFLSRWIERQVKARMAAPRRLNDERL